MPEPPAYPADPARKYTGRPGIPSGRGRRRPSDGRYGHLCISILPAALMAMLGVAAVVCVLTMGGTSVRGQVALSVIISLAVATLVAAGVAAEVVTRRERRPFDHPIVASSNASPGGFEEVQFAISQGRQDLCALAERLAAGELPALQNPGSLRLAGDGPSAHLVNDVRRAHADVWNAFVRAATVRNEQRSSEWVTAVLVNFAWRMQSLCHRAIRGLDELESRVEDPDLLKGLFRVDHLNTIMRRRAESLAVIGGTRSRRQWTNPVTMYEVLRSAIAEIEDYNRVKVVGPVDGMLAGAAVADTIHLVAELVENATKFAPPHTKVDVRAEPVAAGLAIDIEDRGLGIPGDDKRQWNDVLESSERTYTYDLLQGGRNGLVVVSILARRHNIAVQLKTSIYGGTQAIVVIPTELVGSDQPDTGFQQEMPSESIPPVAAAPRGVAEAGRSRAVVQPGSTVHASDRGDGVEGRPGESVAGAAPTSRTAASAVPGPGSGPGPGGSSHGSEKPQLPRRRAQSNLPPELGARHRAAVDDSEDGLNSTMLTAFQEGLRSGEGDGPAELPEGQESADR